MNLDRLTFPIVEISLDVTSRRVVSRGAPLVVIGAPLVIDANEPTLVEQLATGGRILLDRPAETPGPEDPACDDSFLR